MFSFFRKKEDFKSKCFKYSTINSRFKDIMHLKSFIDILLIDFTLDKKLKIKDIIFSNEVNTYRVIDWLTDDGVAIDINNIIIGLVLNLKILYENKDLIDEFDFLDKELKELFRILEINNILEYKV